MKNHLKHMIIGGVAVFALLLAFGVDVGKALPWALLLACPLMMVGMMWSMNRGHGGHGEHDAPSKPQETDLRRDNVSGHQHH